MNELQVFTHPDFGSLEVWIGPDGKPWFPATESAEMLGYANPQEAIRDHCAEAGCAFRSVRYPSGTKQKKYINRPNLSRLIARSHMPGAAQFESWIFDDVLESVFDHGAYMTPETLDKMISSPEFGIRLLTALQEERTAKESAQAQVRELEPKAEHYDTITGSRSAIPFRQAAKVLGYKNVGQNNLFEILRSHGVLMRDNLPYQQFIDRGYFRVIQREYPMPGGDVGTKPQTLIYQKGLDFVRKLLDKAGYQKQTAVVQDIPLLGTREQWWD